MICLIVFKASRQPHDPDRPPAKSKGSTRRVRGVAAAHPPAGHPLLLSCITACAYLGGLATLQHGFPTLNKKEVTIHSKDLSVTSGTISKKLI